MKDIFRFLNAVSPRRRFAILGILLVLGIGTGVYFESVLGMSIVYTHLFYFPIILAGLWYFEKAVFVALGLGLVHISLGFWIGGELVYAALLRAAIFCLVAYFVGGLSRQCKEGQQAMVMLEQEELIIREMQHRVKNNLYIIGSLLELEDSEYCDPAARELLRDAAGRVRALGALYQQLCLKPDQGNTLDLARYLAEVADSVLRINVPETGRILLKKDLTPIAIDSKQGVAVALIVNELMTNVIKYAYSEKDRGVIYLSLHEKDGKIEVAVGDDGCGIENAKRKDGTNGVGTAIIQGMADQLGGQLVTSANDGVRVRLTFPKGARQDHK